MKIGSRADYGLRALLYLAQHHQGCTEGPKPVQIHAIAAQQQIPEDYLRQLLVNLRLSGLVKSVRGPHGGYMLNKGADEITMAEIIAALEGPFETMRCRHLDEGGPQCSIVGACEMRKRWRQANEKMLTQMQNTSLADLVECSGASTTQEQQA